MSSITGVVTTLQPVDTPCEDCVHNYFSGPNIGLANHTSTLLKSNIRASSGGKGKTADQARASALCEAIERHSVAFQGYERRIRSRFQDLDSAIHPHSCLNFSESQYDSRQEWNRRTSKLYLHVPAPFEDDTEIDWTPLWSLTNETFRYLPSLLCFYSYPTTSLAESFCYPDSNGCAAGNSLEEAIFQGLLELVERDAVGIWWHTRARRPKVDLDGFGDPWLERVEACYSKLGRRLWVLDVTSDLGIPTFAAVSARVDQEDQIIVGFGAHLDASVAFNRAVLELNQFLPLAHPPVGTNPVATADQEIAGWLASATLATDGYLVAAEDLPTRRRSDYEMLATGILDRDIGECVERLRRVGVETLVLDVTRPDVGLPVVKVVAPGLRHFWRRLGPGRLYDVPVRLGWVPRPLAEEDLNPQSVFF